MVRKQPEFAVRWVGRRAEEESFAQMIVEAADIAVEEPPVPVQ
jgi:hypothetical protein